MVTCQIPLATRLAGLLLAVPTVSSLCIALLHTRPWNNYGIQQFNALLIKDGVW